MCDNRMVCRRELYLINDAIYSCASDEIEKNEMGGAYSAYGGGERRVHSFGGKT
jgi:hypothetical protein